MNRLRSRWQAIEQEHSHCTKLAWEQSCHPWQTVYGTNASGLVNRAERAGITAWITD
ncbi:hypothetical protein [Chroococcidiopsis cubana]|uniref:hypothetical protein n=1 Tax=Chroococcidiopsis cubana TaxID=171392 RepID=UPI00131522A8|nr:hypothetical protein [Chroococcidiopsis cubana]